MVRQHTTITRRVAPESGFAGVRQLLAVLQRTSSVVLTVLARLDGERMNAMKLRKALETMSGVSGVVVASALFAVSCSQRSPGEKKETGSAEPTTVVGTTGQTTTAAAPAPATQAPGSMSQPATATSGANTTRDPNAISALERMGDYLRTLKAFQIRSETSRDEVLDDGQNVEFGGVVDMIVVRPNRLRAEVTSDKQQRLYFYNGTTLGIWAPRVKYYTTVPAPPTIRELADTLSSKYDIELPLVDLFYWSDRNSTAGITSAVDLGPSQIEGVTCEHYAYRQDGADWQVWTQLGDYPLPRKVVIRTTSDDARPRYASVMTWNLAPSMNDAAFTFVPPSDAKRIALVELKGNQPERSTGH